jgi:alpha-N-arabinofuranosidase
VAVYNDERDEVVLFAVNKDLDEDIEISMDLRQFAGYHVIEHVIQTHDDLFAINTEENPNNVSPVTCDNSHIADGRLVSKLQKHSWNMIRLGK